MVRILFLHGYGQNGEESYSKTASIRKALQNSDFVVPNGAVELTSFDSDNLADRDRDLSNVSPRYAWLYAKEDLTYDTINLEAIWHKLKPVLEQQGPFDGIMGFSQGAAAATAIVSILENRIFNVNHPPLKFAVLFCGARPLSTLHDSLYQDIQTPSLHYIGQQDVMIPLERSLGLASCYDIAEICYHPGSHFIPQANQHTEKIVDFIRTFTAPAAAQFTSSPVIGYPIEKDLAERSPASSVSSRRRPKRVKLLQRSSSYRVQMWVPA